jgi:hypothetical protein
MTGRPSAVALVTTAAGAAVVFWGFAHLEGRHGAPWWALGGAAIAVVAKLRKAPRRRVGQRLDEHFERWPTSNGWRYLRELQPFRDTPFLAEGERADIGCAFAVDLLGREAIVYEHIRVSMPEPYLPEKRTSFVVLRFPLEIPGIPQLAVHPRVDDPGGLTPIPLESTEFENAYVLSARADAVASTVQRLFTPQLIDAIVRYPSTRHYLGESYELGHGQLVLAGSGSIGRGDGMFLERTIRDVQPLLELFVRASSPAPAMPIGGA